MNDIPPAYGQVDVQLNDNGELVDTVMIAGVVGFKVLGDGENRNTLTPYSGWWMFTLDEELKEEAEQRAEWQRQWQMRMTGEVKPRDKAKRRSQKKKEKVQADDRA
jgi:NADH:ubiquinone oxidoreductase subunit